MNKEQYFLIRRQKPRTPASGYGIRPRVLMCAQTVRRSFLLRIQNLMLTAGGRALTRHCRERWHLMTTQHTACCAWRSLVQNAADILDTFFRMARPRQPVSVTASILCHLISGQSKPWSSTSRPYRGSNGNGCQILVALGCRYPDVGVRIPDVR